HTRSYGDWSSDVCSSDLLRIALILLFACQSFWQVLPAYAAFDQSHAAWTAELKKYVDGPLVHYAKWKPHQEGLSAYIALLETIKIGRASCRERVCRAVVG